MATLTYTAGDSEPSFECTIFDRNGLALNMTLATSVEFRARLTTGSTLVTRAGTFVNPGAGIVKFTWATTDLATIGIYNLQIRVTWSPGRWSTHPNHTYDALVLVREVQA